MSDAAEKTAGTEKPAAKPAEKPAAKPADKPAAKPTAPVDWSPKFKTLEEVEKALIRLQNDQIELDAGLTARVEAFFVTGSKPTEPELSAHWLDHAEVLLKEFVDKLEGVKEEHNDKLMELNPAQAETELKKTESQVEAELKALKGTRFASEKAVWRERIEKNLTALRMKQERQADKLQHSVERDADGRMIVRPDEAWWEAYTTWLVTVHELLRTHLRDLLLDRWPRFLDEHVRPLVRTLDASLNIEIPNVPLDDLPNPVAVATRTPASHYRDSDGRVSLDANKDVRRPEEVILSHEIDRAVMSAPQGGLMGMVKSFGGTVLAPLVVLIPGVPMAAKGIITVVIGAPAFLFGLKRQRKLREMLEAERVAKAADALKQKLVADFRRRLDRHKMDLEQFVVGYNAEVQRRVFDHVSSLVSREIDRRKDLIPSEKAELQRRKQRLQKRVNVLDQFVVRPLSGVLVDLEMRRKELRREVQRRAAAEASAGNADPAG